MMESTQAFLAAEAADAIVGFLHRCHRQERPPREVGLVYEENPKFNDSINETYGVVRIFDEEFLASRVLFELAPEPYRLYLGEFLTYEADAGESSAEIAQDLT